jgi:hypothetical protein
MDDLEVAGTPPWEGLTVAEWMVESVRLRERVLDDMIADM